MEPIYENIQPNIGSSFYIHNLSPGCCEPLWHIHPEYELVYVHSGYAEHHIGKSAFTYTNGDLLLIGSNVPHSNLGNQNGKDNFEVVLQMSTDLVEQHLPMFPEFKSLKRLFEMSMHGMSFGEPVKTKAGELLTQMVSEKPFERLLTLLEVLNFLANTKEYKLINKDAVDLEIQSNDYERLSIVNDFVAKNYFRCINLSEVAALTGLTVTSFSRFFKKVTGRTFVGFLNEYRIQKACALLANKNTSITDVMEQSGFVEPSHFSRIFKRYTAYTPRDYRKRIRAW